MYIYMYIIRMPGSKRYSIAEARSNLPSIVCDAEAGLEVQLTRRGKPVAVVISLRKLARLRTDRPSFEETYRHFLSRNSLADVGLEDGFMQSIREKGTERKVSL